MANDADVARLRQGVAVWNAWRAQNPQRPVDLSETDFHAASLRKANLSEANLSEADLRMADLTNADLNLADLRGTILVFTIFNRTILNGANFFAAIIGETVFGNVDLSTTKDLVACEHVQPSIIDYRTLQKSGRCHWPS